MNQENIKASGMFHMVHKRDGKVIDERMFPNLITNAGFAALAGLALVDVGGTAFDYIAIGITNTAANVADTTLASEITTNGGQRAAGTGTRVTTSVTNDTAQLVLTYTFTGSFAVVESGVLNASSSGTLLCRQVFSAINVVSGDTLTVTWKVKFS